MSSSIENKKIKLITENIFVQCAPELQDWIDDRKVSVYTAGNEKKEGENKGMDKKSIVRNWKNAEVSRLKRDLEENKEMLREEDSAYKEIKGAIEKWKDELSCVSYSDMKSYVQYCVSTETQEKIAAIVKKHIDDIDKLERKADMIDAALEFVDNYNDMKKVLQEFGVWSTIIEG